MSWLKNLEGDTLFIEVRARSLRVLHGIENLSIPLARQPSGRLTTDCSDKASEELRAFLKTKVWRPKSRAFCAIDGRGVSLRRLNLPSAVNGDFQRVLRLRIEGELPLPPEALAWGYSQISQKPAADGNNQYLIAALKRELLEDYARLFASAGVVPVFTVAALVRGFALPGTTTEYAILDIGRCQSELISFKDGAAEALRILNWGGDHITRTIEQSLSISRDEAEKLKLQSDDGSTPNGEVGRKIHSAINQALEPLAFSLQKGWLGQKLYLTGAGSRYRSMPQYLASHLSSGVGCERVDSVPTDESTAAIIGLKKIAALGNVQSSALWLNDPKTAKSSIASGTTSSNWLTIIKDEIQEVLRQPTLKRWARMAVLLLVLLILFPLAEALFLKPLLAKKLTTLRSEKTRLPIIDRELSFLQYLKKIQPPYLDTFTVLANSAPPGTRFDTLTMNRRGEVAFKGNIPGAQQVIDFRSKLIKSGFFSSVTVEEQTPSQDRQRMTVRIVAQVKPAGGRPSVKAEPISGPAFPSGGQTPFPDMNGNPGVPFPLGGPSSGKPGFNGGLPAPGTPGTSGSLAIRKGEKTKSSTKVARSPNGEIIPISGDLPTAGASESESKEVKAEDAKDSKESSSSKEPNE